MKDCWSPSKRSSNFETFVDHQTLSCRYAEINTAKAQTERPNKGPAGINFWVAANLIPETGKNQINAAMKDYTWSIKWLNKIKYDISIQ